MKFNIFQPSTWHNIFRWTTKKKDLETPTKTDYYHPTETDWTDNLVSNYDLIEGLCHAEKSGLKLASFSALKIIDKPIQYMGIPLPENENEATQEVLTEWAEAHSNDIKNINRESSKHGTVWIFPFYNQKKLDVLLEFIPDNIVRVIRDIITRKIIKIITIETITITIDIDKEVSLKRTRVFTPEKISIKWEGDKSALEGKADNVEYRNIFGIMPIPFANKKSASEVRGYSDFANVIPQLKAYHDIMQKICNILAKFNPKLTVGVADVAAWKDNNSITSWRDFDLAGRDIFLYLPGAGETKPEMIFLSNIIEPYVAMAKMLFLQIMEGTGVPEMFWGAIVTGNHATAEENAGDLIKYVHDKQEWLTEPYIELYSAIAKLKNLVGLRRGANGKTTIKWNSLDALSESAKSKIFTEFATAFVKLFDSAAMTYQQAYDLWKKLYPDLTTEDFETWKGKLIEVAQFAQYKKASLIDAAGMEGFEDVGRGIKDDKNVDGDMDSEE